MVMRAQDRLSYNGDIRTIDARRMFREHLCTGFRLRRQVGLLAKPKQVVALNYVSKGFGYQCALSYSGTAGT